MWEKIKNAKWLALIIVVVVVALAAITVMAATGWFGTTVPASGTISVTVPATTSTTSTTTTTTAADFNYTVSPSTLNFNDTVWATGSTVLVTCPVTIDNTGNQPINTFTVTATALPAWLHVISQTHQSQQGNPVKRRLHYPGPHQPLRKQMIWHQ